MPRGRRNRDGKPNGGKRPNAGRKPSDNEWFCVRLKRSTRVLIDRFAKSKGMKREEGKQFWDCVILLLLENVIIPEPAYTQFIPAERMRMLSARTAE